MLRISRLIPISNLENNMVTKNGRTRLVTLLVISFLLHVPLSAQVRTLTLEEALKIAADQNKDILKAKEYRKKVMGRYLEERSAAYPQLAAQSSLSRDSDASQRAFGGGFFKDMPVTRNLYTMEVGVSQVLFTWGQVGAAIRAAKEGLEDADDQLTVYQQAVAKDVTTCYFDILLAKDLYQLAQENLQQKQRHLEETKKKSDTGTATDFDILAARVAVENAQPDLIRSENAIRTAREQLRFLLGLEGVEVDGLSTLDVTLQPFPDYQTHLNLALQQRPDLKGLGHQEKISQELVKIYQAGNKPRLDFRGGAGYRHMTIGAGADGGLAYAAGVYLTFPFHDSGRTAGRLMQARSDQESLRLERAKMSEAIALQVRQSINAVRESGEIMQASASNVAQAERLLAMAEKGYEYGVKTRLEVEDAQLNLRLAKSNLIRAKRDYRVACATLDWVTGSIKTNP